MMMPEAQVRLLDLLADGLFHSGTEMAQMLGISRSAVWKHLQVLEGLGLELMALSGKGYRLRRPLQLLRQQAIYQHLTLQAKDMISKLEIWPSIASTNTFLVDMAHRGIDSGRVCLAEYQTAGKGRRGRRWVSPFGHNIYLSVLWRYQNGPAAIAGLSLAVGVATVRALQLVGVEGLGLKWPNDIYWRERKLAGILIEVSGESGGPSHVVVGLGINLYLPPQHADTIDQAWVDLTHILGDEVMQQRNRIVALLLNELLPVVANFEEQRLECYLAAWRSLDCMLGKAAIVRIGEQAFSGRAAGVDEQGLLLLEDESGTVRSFASGEVSLRPA
jgi:BirA family biotin operon repressor/biotin-[acetyl-CoA-carboxylase] ligase